MGEAPDTADFSTPEPEAAEAHAAAPSPGAAGVASGAGEGVSGPGGADRHFRTDHLQADLKGRSVRGGAITLASQGIKFVLRLGSLAVLARLLTPADFGLIAMVAAVTGFVAMFKDAGLSMATIQREQITHEQISTLFWINVALSVGLMAVVAALAPAVAWFYGDPRLTWITLAFAGTFLLSGVMIQHRALLRRQMRFGVLAVIGIVSMTAGIAAAVAAAFAGLGYWALVIQIAAGQAVGSAGMWIACGWRPGLPARRSGVGPMLAFGGNLTGSQFLSYVRRNLDNVLLGAVWGAGALGLYIQAYKLLWMPIQQINSPLSSVALPALSRLQTQPERYRRFYYQFIQSVAFCGIPLVIFALVVTKPLVLVFLGEQWVSPIKTDAVDIFRALGPAALAGTLNMAGGAVFVSLGQTARQFRASVLTSVAVVAGITSGLGWGPLGVAAGFSVSYAGALPFVIAYAYKDSPLEYKDLLLSIWRPAAASVVAGIAAGVVLWTVTSAWRPFLQLMSTILVFGAAYLGCWSLLPGGHIFLRTIVHTISGMQSSHRGRVSRFSSG